MVKEKCRDVAKDGLTLREQLVGLSVDILTPETRRGRYDVSAFNFVARSIAAELRKNGYDLAAGKVHDAIKKYPTEIQKSPIESSIELGEAITSLGVKMFEKFCECENQ